MLNAGALEEVASLERLGLDPSLPAMKALGVPALFSHLRGELSQEDTRRIACQPTRKYAKRQYTWFRNQLTADIEVADPTISQRDAIDAVSRFLLTMSQQRTSGAPFPATSSVGKS